MNKPPTKPQGCLGGCFMIFGLGLAGLFLMAVLGTLVDEKDDPIWVVLVLLVFVAAGVVAILIGVSFFRQAKRLRGYQDLILNQGHRSLDRMANLMGADSVEHAMRDVQLLLNKRHLPGFRLNPENRMVETHSPDEPPEPPKPWMIYWNCEGCGAANQVLTIDGRAACEFCGINYTGPSRKPE